MAFPLLRKDNNDEQLRRPFDQEFKVFKIVFKSKAVKILQYYDS